MIDESGVPGVPRRRPVGRPRLLTREQVIETAALMAPGDLTMTRLAETLGVSPGTLYQYVADRDELIRLVTEKRMRDMPLLQDTGQHWSEYLRGYINRLADGLSEDPAEMIQLLGIESTLEPELRFNEGFYASLVARGFRLDEAIEIAAQVSTIAIGAAMITIRERLAIREAGSMEAALERVLDGLADDDLPLVRKAVRAYEMRRPSIRSLTELLIASIARQRGETAGYAIDGRADDGTAAES